MHLYLPRHGGKAGQNESWATGPESRLPRARDREIAERLRISAVPVVYFGSGHDARILVGAQTPAVLDEFLASG